MGRQFKYLFSSPGHRPCELLSWLGVRRPSVSFSHLNNLLLWNHWTALIQTCQKCSLDGPLPDLCFCADLKFNMAARVHNVFSLAEILKILSETTKSIKLLLCRKDHWVVLYWACESFANRKFKMATMTRLSVTLDPMGISHFHLFFWNHKTDLNQSWQKCSLDGHIQDFCFWHWSEIQHGCQGP